VPRRLLPLLAAVLVAALGLAGLIYGILLATTLAPPATTTARVTGVQGVPVVDTATGTLDLGGPSVRISASSPSGGPVFVGVARADDVTAYLGDVSRVEITKVTDSGTLTRAGVGTAPTLPDPAGADIWVASDRGTGSASVVWPDTAGLFRVVVASDGSAAAPAAITVLWTREQRTNSAPAWITIGALVLVGGLVGLLVLRSRLFGRDGQDDDEGEDDEDEGGFGPGRPGRPDDDATRLIRLRSDDQAPSRRPAQHHAAPDRRPDAGPTDPGPATGPTDIPVAGTGPITFSGGLPLAGRAAAPPAPTRAPARPAEPAPPAESAPPAEPEPGASATGDDPEVPA
jgi:hypothetical protein